MTVSELDPVQTRETQPKDVSRDWKAYWNRDENMSGFFCQTFGVQLDTSFISQFVNFDLLSGH